MKKISLSILIVISTFFISCSKIAFTPKQVEPNAALVYVYNTEAPTDVDGNQNYKIFIDGTSTLGILKENEFVAYDMKPVSVEILAARKYVQRQKIKLNLEAGKIYYLRIETISNDFAKFDFELVDQSIALSEIKDTTVAGKYDTKDTIIDSLLGNETDKNSGLVSKKNTSKLNESQLDALIEKKLSQRGVATSTKQMSSSTTGNKLQDIRNAYEMQKEGLLSQEEFLKMKASILAK